MRFTIPIIYLLALEPATVRQVSKFGSVNKLLSSHDVPTSATSRSPQSSYTLLSYLQLRPSAVSTLHSQSVLFSVLPCLLSRLQILGRWCLSAGKTLKPKAKFATVAEVEVHWLEGKTGQEEKKSQTKGLVGGLG